MSPTPKPSKSKSLGDLIAESAKVEPSPPPRPAGESERVRPKYAQIRPDQWADLDVLARELMDERTTRGRRITANTLIRIAIDALLAQRGGLVGNDEDELRANYFRSLGVRKS